MSLKFLLGGLMSGILPLASTSHVTGKVIADYDESF